MTVAADLASSFRSFFDAAGSFFANLADVHWGAFVVALLFLAAMQVARARAWFNVLGAAYPDKPISFLRICAAYLAGAGMIALIPAPAR